jgi:hypothetical protein
MKLKLLDKFNIVPESRYLSRYRDWATGFTSKESWLDSGKKSRKHFVLYSVQSGSVSQPASYPVDAGGSFSGDKAAGALTWPLAFHLVSGLRTLGVTNPPPPHSCKVCTVTTYQSALTCVYMKLFLNSLCPYINVRPSDFFFKQMCGVWKRSLKSNQNTVATLFFFSLMSFGKTLHLPWQPVLRVCSGRTPVVYKGRGDEGPQTCSLLLA